MVFQVLRCGNNHLASGQHWDHSQSVSGRCELLERGQPGEAVDVRQLVVAEVESRYRCGNPVDRGL